jgi:predicted Zn-dependent protease
VILEFHGKIKSLVSGCCRLTFVLLMAAVIGGTGYDSGFAQNRNQGLALVRDAEIEALLKDYTTSIFRAAGLGQGAVDIYIVNDSTFNAFVSGSRMFINTGALKTAETPNEIIGVLAHETGHIMGGHMARLRDRVDRANILAALSLLAGAGAIALGGDAGAAAGSAIALGGQSAIMRDLLAYRRSEEISADNAAVTLLNKTGQSARGMIKTFERFNQNILFSGSRGDPYFRSHPMPRDRIALLENIARKSKFYDVEDPATLQLRHDMARAKIAAYNNESRNLQTMFRDNPQGIAARYGLAIAYFLRGSTDQALPIIDRLIPELPSNPYLHEMKGEMLLKGRRANEAAAEFRKAIALAKRDSGLLRVQLGHALLETRNPKNIGEAIREIKAGLSRDPTNTRGYGFLARAYSTIGESDLARAAAAEEAYYAFRIDDAKQLAHFAQSGLKRGTPEWLRMQDIIDFKPPKKN